MIRPRLIPCLLLRDRGLVKTVRFSDPTYLGDPINIVRLFNDKKVDELVLLDITSTPAGRPPPYELLRDIASECFMPLCYGGGVRSVEDMRRLYELGIEKVCLNSGAVEDSGLVTAAAERFGRQAVMVSIDVKRGWFGREWVATHGGRKPTELNPVEHARAMEKAGAGEILLTAIDRDGTMQGYDLALVARVARAVSIPVVACGGAARLADAAQAVAQGASAPAAGSMFVFQGRLRAVLITYPTGAEIDRAMKATT